jgi:adenylyltransferase/sulfurtransferase
MSHEPLSTPELQRYARQLSIPDFGLEGQTKLKNARVLCIGAGGLGSPISLYLAAAGVGLIGLVDADTVDLSNLQRQILYGTSDVGRSKLEAARERLLGINPHVEIVCHPARFTAANAREIVEGYDVVIDGTDNFPTRYLSNDVCVWMGKPNIYGSILRFEGQVSVFAPHLGGPCYRCMVPQPPAPGLVPTCAEGGVLGVLPGIVGSMQALEAIKVITGMGEPLIGRLLHVDTLAMRFRTIQLRRDPECPVCGTHPSITEPIDYHQFCGMSIQPPPPVPTLTVQDLREIQQSRAPHFLLDVREPSEHVVAHIEGATLIPLGELPSRLGELPSGTRILVHCKLGGRSAKAVALLQENGFADVWNVAGGIMAWSNEIDSGVPIY